MEAVRSRALGSLAVLAVAVAAVATVGGCASLPLPGTPDESLVVISTTVVSESWPAGDGIRRVAGGQIHLTVGTGGRDIVVSFAPGTRYVALAVAPGQYYVKRVVLDMENTNPNGRKNTWQSQHDVSATFYCGANSVQILSRGLVVVRSGPEGWNVTLNNPIVAQDRRQIGDALKADRRWPAWEEYQLVNSE